MKQQLPPAVVAIVIVVVVVIGVVFFMRGANVQPTGQAPGMPESAKQEWNKWTGGKGVGPGPNAGGK